MTLSIGHFYLARLGHYHLAATGPEPEPGWVCVPIGKDYHAVVSRQRLAPQHEAKLEKIGLDWATFQVLRKTNASLSKKAGVDLKVASDQRGHGVGVSLEVYTSSDLEQKRDAVRKLEASVLRKSQQKLSA